MENKFLFPNSKKGLSTVVTTLIIVLLVIVAIGIVWLVIRNVIETGIGNVDYNTKCLSVDMEITDVNCQITPDQCEIIYTRNPGGDEISGIKIILNNGTDTGSPMSNQSAIGPLETNRWGINPNVDLMRPMTLEVNLAAYFLDDSGDEHVCGIIDTYSTPV